jgi:HEAT repeat protein
MRSAPHVLIWIGIAGLLAALPARVPAQQDPPALGDQTQLISVLQSDAGLYEKAKACQRLATIGTADCVPVLAGLLDDEQLSHYARTGLEPNPSPAAGTALRDALGRLSGALQIGVINSIGMRRDAAAVEQLKTLLGNSDTGVSAAAAAALGRIASDDAVAALKQALQDPAMQRAALADACLTAAEMLFAADQDAAATELYDALLQADGPALAPHLHIAALLGAIRARGPAGVTLLAQQLAAEDKDQFAVGLRMAHELQGDAVTEALVNALDDLPAGRRGLVIYVLGDRGDRDALAVILDAARSGPPETRLPALSVLATMGDASSVPVLLLAATQDDPDLAAAARDSLIALPGDDVDQALVDKLQDSQGPQRLVLIQLAGERGITAAVPTLMQLASDSNAELRLAVVAALGLTVGPENLPSLIRQLVNPLSDEDAAAAKAALTRAVLRMPDRDACAAQLMDAMSDAPLAAKKELLALLGVVGGDQALDGVAAAARDRNEEVQDVATQVLGEWMSPDAAPKLLELAQTLDNNKYQIRALRGYIRIPRQFGIPVDERLAMCRKALEVAERDAEKALVLDALTRVNTTESLNLVVSYLDQPGLQEAAGTAAVSIAEKLLQSDRAAVAEAMQQVIDAGATGENAVQAKLLLRRSKR